MTSKIGILPFLNGTILFFCLLIMQTSTAQENIETEDGNLIIQRINLQASAQISTTGANADAVVKVGDSGNANDAVLGWDGGNDMFKLNNGSVLDNFGFIMDGTGTNTKFGLGTLPDANSKVFINYNSSDGSPHLFLRENNNGDDARLQFGQFGITDFWQLAGFAGADPNFTFNFNDGTGADILTIDGDDGDVTIENGDLAVKKTGGFQAAIEISTGGASSDARLEFGDDGSANDAVLGWDGGDDMFKISNGSSLDNNGFMMEGTGGNTKFGLGSQPDDNALVFINHNSVAGVTAEPHLFLRENNNTDFARLQFGNFNVSGYWHIAAKTASTAQMNFYYHNGTTGNNIIVADGPNADVGIDRTPTANDLEVNGTASKTAAGDWLANSDRRIKTDIRNIENSFETMLKLRPVKFKYSDEWMKRNPSLKDQYYYNFIAQEYQEVFPESVQGSGEHLEGEEEEILQIDTYNAQIVTIAAAQELIRENTRLKEEIATLKQTMQGMTDSHNEMASDLKSIKDLLNLRIAGSNSDE
ncbi:MAG: tail fiber domain-containing protein [Saprospiraceae bacterium]|nr:tail fiber domain-containing protein [Saprospiraceae bacterium]